VGSSRGVASVGGRWFLGSVIAAFSISSLLLSSSSSSPLSSYPPQIKGDTFSCWLMVVRWLIDLLCWLDLGECVWVRAGASIGSSSSSFGSTAITNLTKDSSRGNIQVTSLSSSLSSSLSLTCHSLFTLICRVVEHRGVGGQGVQ